MKTQNCERWYIALHAVLFIQMSAHIKIRMYFCGLIDHSFVNTTIQTVFKKIHIFNQRKYERWKYFQQINLPFQINK